MHLLVTDQQVFLWTLLLTVPCLPKVAWPRKTLTLFQMIKSLIVSGAVVTAAALASPVSAGSVFVNPEYNTSVGTDSGVGGAILEGHIGYEFDNGAYVQVGPAISLTMAKWKTSRSAAKLVSAAVLSTEKSASSPAMKPLLA